MHETMLETTVTYSIDYQGKRCTVEHVPARVCQETGEARFAPETVERIQAQIQGGSPPDRVLEMPVFDFARSPAQLQ